MHYELNFEEVRDREGNIVGYSVSGIHIHIHKDFDGCVNIPERHGEENLDVVQIGDAAFMNNNEIKEVHIPRTVSVIGNHAFEGCGSLERILGLDDNTVGLTIGEYAFCDCTKLMSIRIPILHDGRICANAFYGCGRLIEVCRSNNGIHVEPGGCKHGRLAYYARNIISLGEHEAADVAERVFTDANGFKFYYFERENGQLEAYLVDYCGNIENGRLVLPNGFEARDHGRIYSYAINSYALHGSDIESITIPASVNRICKDAFHGCGTLREIHVNSINDWLNIEFDDESANPLSGGASLFVDGRLVNMLEIPEDIRRIKKYAFVGTSFGSVTIPESVSEIGDGAFKNSGVIGELRIDDVAAWCGITFGDVDSNPMRHAESLCVRDGDGNYRNLESTNGRIAIPEGVNAISSFAFYKCGQLRTVSFPRTLDENEGIGDYAFYKCASLEAADGLGMVTAIGHYAFYGCPVFGEGYRCNRIEAHPDGFDYDVDRHDVDRHDIDVAEKIGTFMDIYGKDGNSRYRSFDYVHRAFLDYKREPNPEKIDSLALNLYMFLASWGMLRNSFLLNKDYKFLTRICEIVCEEKYDWLMDVNPLDEDFSAQYYIFVINDLNEKITEYFESNRFYKLGDKHGKAIDKVSCTLVSKILLATLGCVPAFDRFARAAVSALLYNNLNLNNVNILQNRYNLLNALLGFVDHYRDDINEVVERYGEMGIGYPVMKYVDMILWVEGYNPEQDDEDELDAN